MNPRDADPLYVREGDTSGWTTFGSLEEATEGRIYRIAPPSDGNLVGIYRIRPRRRVGPLALVLAAISGAIVGAIITAAIVRAAPRSAQVVIPAAVPDVSRTILGLTGAPMERSVYVEAPNQVRRDGRGAPTHTASPNGQAVPERPGAVPPSAPGPLTGTASWYAASGLIAAAGPALRHGDWRGSRVTVHGNGRSVTVTLSDWCQCYGSRLIDLSDDAFRRLAPLSRGLLKVTIDASSAATLPPTDEELP